MKLLIQTLFVSFTGITGNLIAAYIEHDVWSNAITPMRLGGTIAAFIVALLFLTYLDSDVSFILTWRWHQHWYLRDVLADPTINRWAEHFGALDFLRKNRPLMRAEVVKDGTRTPLPLTTALIEDVLANDADARRVLVVGEPGAGKTTGLERLTWELAFPQRKLRSAGSRVPILVRLNHLQSATIEDFITKSLETNTESRSGKILAAHFRDLVAKGRCVLLLDALDEALASKDGEGIKRQLAELVTSRSHKRVPIVVTSRTREEPGFIDNIYEIQDLSDQSVRELIAYFRPQDDTDGIWEQLTSNRLLVPRALGRNPFWLEYLLREGSFTGSREELIDRVITKLLEVRLDVRSKFDSGVDHVLVREFGKARPWKLPSNLTPDEGLRTSRRALAWLAYRMSVAGVTALSEEEAKKDFQSWLEALPVPLGWTADDLLHLGQDAQLLNYPYDQSTGFRHRLLQETLTAWGMTHEPAIKGHWSQEIEAHADDVAWWQTLVLLAEAGSSMERLLEPILQAPTAQRLTLAAVLAEYVPGTSTLSAEYVTRVRSRFYADVRSGIKQEHMRAVDALQRLAGNAVISLIWDMLTGENQKSEVFNAGVELLLVLDTRILQALSDILTSTDFAKNIAVEQVATVQILLPTLQPSIAAALLSQVSPDISASMITHLENDFQESLIGKLMLPAAAGYMMLALEPSTAHTILGRIDAGRTGQILSVIGNPGARLLQGMTPLAVSQILGRTAPEAASRILATLPFHVVQQILADTAPEAAGRILGVMPSQAVRQILAALPSHVVQQILAETPSEAAGWILAALLPEAASRILTLLPPEAAGRIFADMIPQAAGQIMATARPEVTGRILTLLPPEAASRIMATTRPEVTGRILAALPPEAAGRIQATLSHEALGVVQNRGQEGIILSNLGEIARRRGQLKEAEVYFQQALAILREVQDRREEGVVLSNLGEIAGRRGQLKEAEVCFTESLAIFREVQDRQGEGTILAYLGLLAEKREEWQAASTWYRQGLEALGETQKAANIAPTSRILGEVLIEHLDRHEEGCQLLQTAVKIYQQMGLVDEAARVEHRAQELGCIWS